MPKKDNDFALNIAELLTPKPKKPRGKPFAKGADPRRSKRGKQVRNTKHLEAAIDKIFDRVVAKDTETGEDVTQLEVMLVRLANNKNVAANIHMLDRRFGKVKEQLEIKGQVTWASILAQANKALQDHDEDNDGEVISLLPEEVEDVEDE